MELDFEPFGVAAAIPAGGAQWGGCGAGGVGGGEGKKVEAAAGGGRLRMRQVRVELSRFKLTTLCLLLSTMLRHKTNALTTVID